MDMTLSDTLTGAVERVQAADNGSAMQQVSTDLIEVGHRIRALGHDELEGLIASIADVGLLNPITVYRRPITRGGKEVDGFGLIAGAHRLAACRHLGHTEIPVVIVEMDRLRRILAECDENLCGAKLSPTERIEFTERRKEAYEQLYPETVQYVAGGKARQGAASDNLSFAEATAASTGKNVRTVQREAARAAKVGEDVRALVKRTKLDTGVYLDGLAGLSPKEQKQRVQADLEMLRDGHRNAPASSGKTVCKANLGKTSAKSKSSQLQSNAPANRPDRFAWLMEEVAGYTRAEFNEWLTTEPNCKQAVTKANAYAASAAAMIGHFQATHPKAKG
jgi:ParB-like chromosome segregation protein Spo0J